MRWLELRFGITSPVAMPSSGGKARRKVSSCIRRGVRDSEGLVKGTENGEAGVGEVSSRTGRVWSPVIYGID